ncbi:MAG: hypothetical protein ABIG67_07625 [Pseudomonadota bacterium]
MGERLKDKVAIVEPLKRVYADGDSPTGLAGGHKGVAKDGYGGLFSKKTRPLQGLKRSCHLRRAAKFTGLSPAPPKRPVTE